MVKIWDKIYYGGELVESGKANIHIASSAVLYGLSVYTVFPINKIGKDFYVFRIEKHLERLQNSAKIMGLELPKECQDMKSFLKVVKDLVKENRLGESVFARATIHVDALVAGTKSKGLSSVLSIFLYEAKSIVPQDGARLKVSPWRRNPDFCIPSRAKVNGGYVNSVLAKQDAIDSGYDDAILLDINGQVSELSAANIFIVRDGKIITPGTAVDILEGINRLTLLEIAKQEKIEVVERAVDMTELYIADEVFACGTSAFVAPVINIDGRKIGTGKIGEITKKLKTRMQNIQLNKDKLSKNFLTKI
jgi:branched-chain amino acid aminotransferase